MSFKIFAVAFIGVAMGAALILTVQHERESIRAICQPRGYVGGFMDRYGGEGCIARDGSRVLIRDLQQ